MTKIIQGPTEPFSDFVARLVEAAGKIFGDPDTAMPLVKQLAYEQRTKECRAAITSYKNRGLEYWMRACRELGDPLTNSRLAVAVLRLSKNGNNTGTCFRCGKTGHIRRNCPQGGNRDMPRKLEMVNAQFQDYAPDVKKEGIGRLGVGQ